MTLDLNVLVTYCTEIFKKVHHQTKNGYKVITSKCQSFVSGFSLMKQLIFFRLTQSDPAVVLFSSFIIVSMPYPINAPIHFKLIQLFCTPDIFHFTTRGKTAYCWLNLSKQHLYKLFFFTPLPSSITLALTQSAD